MAYTTDTRLKRDLLSQERAYLEAVQERQGDRAAELTAPESLVVSGNGAMRVDGDMIRQMVQQHDETRRYELDEATVEVVPVTDDVAIIAYKLRTLTADGVSAGEAYDTDVWVQRDGRWMCALHAEVPANAA